MSENIQSRRLNLRSFKVNKDSTNASLWLNKYIIEQKVEKKESTAKQDLVNQVSNIKVPVIYEDFYKDIWLKSLEKTEKNFIEISGRMIIGLGAESVLETSIMLHRTYGVPYIPGSALKGLAASFAHRFMGEGWNKEKKDKVAKETKAIGKAHKLMFGSQDSAGYVIFHDALYVPDSYKNKPKNPLEIDILTVHHSEYYQEGKLAPADWDSPVPIPLLSAQGQYLLAVSANSGDSTFDEKMVKLAIEILGLALEQEGIGAKTSSGYGRASLKAYSENPNNNANLSEVANADQKETANNSPESSKSEEQKNAERFEGIKKRLEEVGKYDKEEFKKIFKTVKKLPIESQLESCELMIDLASKDPSKPVFENAGWFVESKEIVKKGKL